MITAINATVTHIEENLLTCAVDSFFFSLIAPNTHNFKIHEKYKIFTYLHWNSENGFSLYGFYTESEKILFLALISCSGIGPKLAITIIGNISISSFVSIIERGDLEQLTTIPGIGQKKGEYILVSLKHTLKNIKEHLKSDIDENIAVSYHADVEKTLSALQYSKAEIQRALRCVNQERKTNIPEKDSFDLFLRQALKHLSQKTI
jgi:Holliday junction DNA helicase RuvA